MNKDLKLKFCKKCNRKRFCRKEAILGNNFKITCSKGHSWIVEGFTIERVNAVLMDVFTPEKVSKLFERYDIFYKSLK